MKSRPVALVVAEQARLSALETLVRSASPSSEVVVASTASRAEEELERGNFAYVVLAAGGQAELDAFLPALGQRAELPLVVHWQSAAPPDAASCAQVEAWSTSGPLEGQLLAQAIDRVLTRRRGRAFAQLLQGQVAHDLRGPLGIVDMGAQLQIEALTLEAVPPLARRIRNATRRLRDLCSDVVELGRLRLAPGGGSEPSWGELGPALAARFEELRLDHSRRALEWEARGDTKGVWDAPRFALLLSALVDTVARASQSPAAVRVKLDAEEAERVVLSVTAAGAEFEERVLEVSRSRFDEMELWGKEEPPGVPLRLFLARSLADELGGELSILDGGEPGFRFEIGRAP